MTSLQSTALPWALVIAGRNSASRQIRRAISRVFFRSARSPLAFSSGSQPTRAGLHDWLGAACGAI